MITNNHVVAQAAEDNGPIEIVDHNGKHMKATDRRAQHGLRHRGAEAPRRPSRSRRSRSARPDQMRVGETWSRSARRSACSATVTSGIISAVEPPGDHGRARGGQLLHQRRADRCSDQPRQLRRTARRPAGRGGGRQLRDRVPRLAARPPTRAATSASGFAIPIEQVQVTTAQILKTGKAQYPIIGANVQRHRRRRRRHRQGSHPRAAGSGGGPRVGDVIAGRRQAGHRSSKDLVVAIRTHVTGDKVTSPSSAARRPSRSRSGWTPRPADAARSGRLVVVRRALACGGSCVRRARLGDRRRSAIASMMCLRIATRGSRSASLRSA